ncbi:hypothetical protein Hanom_Chr03g00224361 [Helianthus anomalus]
MYIYTQTLSFSIRTRASELSSAPEPEVLDAKLLSSRGVSLEAASLFLWGRGKAVYISSDPTLALLLVGFTEYDDDDDLDKRTNMNFFILFVKRTNMNTHVVRSFMFVIVRSLMFVYLLSLFKILINT